MYKINHIHLKSSDPESTADWWVKAFNFKLKVILLVLLEIGL